METRYPLQIRQVIHLEIRPNALLHLRTRQLRAAVSPARFTRGRGLIDDPYKKTEVKHLARKQRSSRRERSAVFSVVKKKNGLFVKHPSGYLPSAVPRGIIPVTRLLLFVFSSGAGVRALVTTLAANATPCRLWNSGPLFSPPTPFQPFGELFLFMELEFSLSRWVPTTDSEFH